MPPLLGSQKKVSIAVHNKLLFSINFHHNLILSDSLWRKCVAQTCVCGPDNSHACVGLPVPDLYRGTAQFGIDW